MTRVVQWLFQFKDYVPLRFTPSACATRMANPQCHLNVSPASKTLLIQKKVAITCCHNILE